VKVFSNTTPFIAFASIDKITLLPQVFESIYIAESVYEECAEGGPVFVPDLKQEPWINIVADDNAVSLPVQFELDRGEKQTIALALQHDADVILMDERIGRRVAEYFGIRVTGTLGVLAKAKSMGLISSFHETAMDMRAQGIFFNVNLITRLATYLGE